MPSLDRGDNFGGYYRVDPSRPNVIFGASWENSFPCGTYVEAGVTHGVTFFIFYKDEFPDCRGVHAESFDVDVSYADMVKEENVVAQAILAGISPPMEGLSPTVQYLLQSDLAAGYVGQQIIDRRAAIIVPEFLGFFLDSVRTDHPEVWQPTIIDGVEIPNIMKCSLEVMNL